jgi:hypothetical protein
MNIDEPIKAAEALIASDARQRSVVSELIAEIAAALESPFSAIATFLNKRRAENLDLLVTVLRDNLQRLIERVGQLSEQQQRFLRTDFAELVADGLRKAENIRAKNRIVRIAMILGTVAETGPSMLLDNAEELMRIAVNLSDLDVAVLREIYHAQSEHLKNSQTGRVNRESANEAWRDFPPKIDGVSEGDIQSCCATLLSFGLVARVERNEFKLGPNEIPYALLKRGAVFVEFSRNV